ncbi:MAG: hypothetical protein ABIR60_08620 [Allosphingosinicella sp.]
MKTRAGDRGFDLPLHIYTERTKPIRVLCGALGVHRDRAVALKRWRSVVLGTLEWCGACKAKATNLRRRPAGPGPGELAGAHHEPIALELDAEADEALALVEALELIADRVEAAAAAKVDEWNARHPVGQAVNVTRDNGQTLTTTTRSPAQVLAGHSAVIWVDGVDGCYLLDRVAAVV